MRPRESWMVSLKRSWSRGSIYLRILLRLPMMSSFGGCAHEDARQTSEMASAWIARGAIERWRAHHTGPLPTHQTVAQGYGSRSSLHFGSSDSRRTEWHQ